ncbi:hypothetical protein NBRC116583_38350 [Arenicella sp. 4NH20-0111]|uniref:hypothetical protein n=1 Tax=Arenicella sp. 4NH20-0111 TaxID=3127648 RepID=UPI003105D8AB
MMKIRYLVLISASLCFFAGSLIAAPIVYVTYKGYRIPIEEHVYGDSDDDGISDEFDICANTTNGEPVNGGGCSASQQVALVNCIDTVNGQENVRLSCYDFESQDTDRDGIIDANDAYPHQSALMCPT